LLAPSEFDGTRTAGYLDTATYGLPPRSTLAALERALAGWREWEDWMCWEEDGEACRALFARVLGARAQDVALLPALSVASGIVAASLPAAPGDNVVCYEDDFQSALFPWISLERRGVEVRARPLDRLIEAIDERTALVAVSFVQSADGRVIDLAALAQTGARLFVDATQGVGALPIDLDGIDYLAGGAYKWLLCPRGFAFLYVRPERLPEIEPWLAGWKSAEDVYERIYGLPRKLTADARRLDISLPWLVAAGSRASLEVVCELGVERIAEHDLGLARRFCAGLGLPEPGSPIVRVPVPDADAALAQLEKAGIRAAGRAGALRLSFHLYNDEADADRTLDVLSGLFASQSLSS
jgi:selenocysteine lyase/cysteine desulfurase